MHSFAYKYNNLYIWNNIYDFLDRKKMPPDWERCGRQNPPNTPPTNDQRLFGGTFVRCHLIGGRLNQWPWDERYIYLHLDDWFLWFSCS